MALRAEVGTLTSPAATGNQSYATSRFSGDAPKILFMWGSRLAADGVSAKAQYGFGCGISSTSRFALAMSSQDGVGTSSTDRRHDNAKIISLLDATTVEEAADLVSFTADQFTLDWTTVLGTGLDYGWLALGGDDLTNVHIKQITSPEGTTGNQAYTGVGFQPDAVMVLSVADTQVPPAANGTLIYGMGFGVSSTERFCSSINSQDAQGTSDTHSYQIADKIISMQNGGVFEEADLVSLDSDGFTLNWTVANGSARYYWVISLKGGQYAVGTDTQNTSTGTKNTDLGFAAQAVMLQSVMGANSAAVQNGNRYCFGAVDGGSNDSCAGELDENGQATTDADRFFDSNEVQKYYDHAQTLQAAASGSISGNNLALNWTTADATAREFNFLAIGAAPSGTTILPLHNHYMMS